ncbi:RNA polymerase sigma factor [Miltoncostaea oceani]|uniref:RNA polymerase sigma factor n=1 Tax=Miltoncostaea oceani TaxID=2843216 RepID=UPI001C3D2025|nr:sigma-70 family RNA polymerase sigma factor [Miltoncostaea oceani]
MTSAVVHEEVLILERASEGDERALELLYDLYAPAAYGLAVRMVGERREAEDVVQEAFMTLWRSGARQFDPERGTARGWFMASVRNRALDHLRARARHNRRVAVAEQAARVVSQVEAPTEDLVIAVAQQSAAREVLATLGEDQRRVIELAYFDGLTHREIAADLGVPTGTVKSRLRVGLEKMRTELRERGWAT